MSLLALQRDFRKHLTGAPVTMESWVGNGPPPGLAVYHNAYRVQLTECLAETFEHTHAWLGGEAFLTAVRDHIERLPPSGWTLGVYGEGFDRTLAALYPDDPEVAELAQLEWLLARAFEGANADPLPMTAIASIDWDSAVLRFVPTMRIVAASSNAGAIWSALAAGTPPPAAAILPQAGAILVWRNELTPCFRTIEIEEQEALEEMAAGTSFAEYCAAMIDRHGEAEGVSAAGALLGRWFEDGLIAAAGQEEFR